MANALVRCDNLVKIYKEADLEVVALQGLDLEVQPGEMLALVGASGSGKTTLLNILGGLDTPSAGGCVVAGHNLLRLSEKERLTYRQSLVGHLWQQSGRNLFPELTAAANIELPQLLIGISRARRKRRVQELLELIGMGAMGHKQPHQLSGGEQQRVALAVALANHPLLLLADEPTGELDSVTAGEICALLRRLNTELRLTVLVVTHDVGVASLMDRTIAIRDGRTSTETIRRQQPLADNNRPTSTRSSAVVGLSSQTHRESALIDRVGRLQLPQEALDRLPFNGRAEVIITDDHVELWPMIVSDVASAQEGFASSPGRRTQQGETAR